MCGIVGLYLKTPKYEKKLGKLFTPLLNAMHNRGPDSAGFAIYHDRVNENQLKMILHHPDLDFDWQTLTKKFNFEFQSQTTVEVNSTHAKVITDVAEKTFIEWIEKYNSDISLMSSGKTIEIYKEVGSPKTITKQFNLENMTGTHIIGHTRMATESAITTQGSHPFSTGADLCLVHNGSLSNNYRLKEQLEPKGYTFKTENDTEVAAVYLTDKLISGNSLKQSMEKSLQDLDGFFTFAVGTEDGFSVLRDEFGCKPAVLAETDDYVGIASEFQALSSLPGINYSKVWEPVAGKVYSW